MVDDEFLPRGIAHVEAVRSQGERADGRYVEARGTREAAYIGRYEIEGDHIRYWDDSGFTADGTFIEGVLHHAGMVMTQR